MTDSVSANPNLPDREASSLRARLATLKGQPALTVDPDETVPAGYAVHFEPDSEK